MTSQRGASSNRYANLRRRLRRRRVASLVPAVLLSACGSLNPFGETPPPTLADLQPVALPSDVGAPPEVTLGELAELYRDALPEQADSDTRYRVSHRLADIEMLGAEEQLAGSEDEADFSAAITAYESLLEEDAEHETADRTLYQLSKAYDLDGRPEKSQALLAELADRAPDSPYLPEAYFRRAERSFVDTDYNNAQMLYTQVVDYGNTTPYYTRALYMQGWSRFKREHLNGAVASFTESLDQLLLAGNASQVASRSDQLASAPEGIGYAPCRHSREGGGPTYRNPVTGLEQSANVEAVAQPECLERNMAEPSELTRAEQELVQDSLRILAITFDKQGGTPAIAAAYDTLGERPYEHLLYDALGSLYLTQERYTDSAGTFHAFTRRHPNSRKAHHFARRTIEAYTAGGFTAQVVSAKADYVAHFGVQGDYWQASDATARAAMAEHLKTYIEELATHHHALAQADDAQQGTARDAFRTAATYYQLYLDSFPEDGAVARLGFLLGESLYEAGDYVDAIAAYDWVAYVHGESQRAADAAYTAILAYEKLLEAPQPDGRLERLRIDAELRFFDHFAGDARAAPVLGHAAGALLALADYPAAIAAANRLTALAPDVSQDLLIPAWLASGHGYTALDQFVDAEWAYREVLGVMPQTDERRADTVERLAAAIYYQGEEARADGDDRAAAEHFKRVLMDAPESSVSLNAQFDAAAALSATAQWDEANALLVDFRLRYPHHALSAQVGPLLLGNYEQQALWGDAARELDALRATNSELEDRESLLAAAQYYDRARDSANAIARYRDYAHNYPEPLIENIEAMQRLNELYTATGETDKRHYWLSRIMARHDAALEPTGRTYFLAAQSASVLAEHADDRFQSIRLALPLEKTLPQKTAAMQVALKAYERCTDYAVEQFVTGCTYRLAEVYQHLSRALLNSPRPAELDALAREQYDIMLEEQAYPFEEQAIAIHEGNARRVREGLFDEWIQNSLTSLATLLPARYRKVEKALPDQLPEGTPDVSRRVVRLNQEGIRYREAGDFDRAAATYLEALGEDEHAAMTHLNLGILYDLYLGKPGRALYHYTEYQFLTGGEDRTVLGWIKDLERQELSLAQGGQ